MDQLLLLVPLALLALLLLSGRRRQRAAAETQRTLAPGSRVITTAGLYATVVEVEDVAVVLETSPGVRSRWARGAVARVLPEAATGADLRGDGDPGADAGADVTTSPGADGGGGPAAGTVPAAGSDARAATGTVVTGSGGAAGSPSSTPRS